MRRRPLWAASPTVSEDRAGTVGRFRVASSDRRRHRQPRARSGGRLPTGERRYWPQGTRSANGSKSIRKGRGRAAPARTRRRWLGPFSVQCEGGRAGGGGRRSRSRRCIASGSNPPPTRGPGIRSSRCSGRGASDLRGRGPSRDRIRSLRQSRSAGWNCPPPEREAGRLLGPLAGGGRPEQLPLLPGGSGAGDGPRVPLLELADAGGVPVMVMERGRVSRRVDTSRASCLVSRVGEKNP